MRYPLVPVALSFALGIGAAPFLFLSASQLVLWVSVVFGGAVLLLRVQRYSYGLFAALIGFFVLRPIIKARLQSPMEVVTLREQVAM